MMASSRLYGVSLTGLLRDITQVPATFKPAPGGEPEMFVQLDVVGYTLGGN